MEELKSSMASENVTNNSIHNTISSVITKHSLDCKTQFEEIETNISDFELRISNILSIYELKLRREIELMEENVHNEIVQSDQVRNEQYGKIAACQAAIKAELESLSASYEKKLIKIQQDFNNRLDGLIEFKKQVDDKMDLVALNGTNSTLRSSNNERHLQLIEKKIENIYQLIKELQLR